jgi:hypothetical protein
MTKKVMKPNYAEDDPLYQYYYGSSEPQQPPQAPAQQVINYDYSSGQQQPGQPQQLQFAGDIQHTQTPQHQQHQSESTPYYAQPQESSIYQPYYPPPKKGLNKMIIIIVVTVVMILIFGGLGVVIWLGSFEGSGSGSLKVSSYKTENSNAWVITISSMTGGTLNIDEIRFELEDESGYIELSTWIGNANPSYILKSSNTIYPIPSGSNKVDDGKIPVIDKTNLLDYQNCTMAIVDAESDGRLNTGDSIWIYKDIDNDAIPDTFEGSNFLIKDSFGEMIHRKRL